MRKQSSIERAVRRWIRRLDNTEVAVRSIRKGDWVECHSWPYHALEVIDVNWALLAVAVRLYGTDGKAGDIVVWPMRSIIRKF